jgi:hypothetical protein
VLDRDRLISSLRAPSPALAISIIALIVAVAGGTFAVAALNNKKAKKIANKVVTRRAPGLSVASAESANPSLFAEVGSDGTVNAADSKGVTQANVSNGSAPGYYCFTNLSFAPRGGQATIDYNGSFGPGLDTIADLGLGNPVSGATCPAGTQVFVETRNTDQTGGTPAAFFIALYR